MTGKKKPELNGSDAIRSAFRLLSYRDRSEKELAERLKKKGFSDGIIRDTVEYLKEKKFLDDDRLAQSLKRIGEEVKLLGSAGLRGFLGRRGIPGSIINDVVADDDSDEAERAKKLLDRKLRTMRNYPDDEIRIKLWRFLMRKGYSSEAARRALGKIKTDAEE